MQSSDPDYTNPVVGQQIYPLAGDIPEGMDKQPATVLSIDRTDSVLPVFAELANGQRWWCTGWEPYIATDIIEPQMIPVSDHDRTVETLNAQIRELAAERDRLDGERNRQTTRVNELRRHYDHDMTWLNDFFKDTLKSEMGWCDDGYNAKVDHVNNHITGGFQFDRAAKWVEHEVQLVGTTKVSATVYVLNDCNDPDDPDNWAMDEDGNDSISDVDDWMQERLAEEFSRMRNRFDDVEAE